MKNILKFLPALALLAFVFTACEKEDVDNVPSEVRGSTIKVGNNTGLFDFVDLASSAYQFEVSTLGEDVSSVEVYKSYNGGARVLHTTLNSLPATVTLTPETTVEGLGIIVDSLQLEDNFTISFDNVVSGSGSYPSSTSFNIPVTCLSELAGFYTVTTTYGYHDFLPDFNPHTLDSVEIVEVSAGLYETTDFSGGLYSEGPYVTAYGTTGLPTQFTDVCDQLSWIDQSDEWGAMIPLAGGVNSVDPNTGVITISWFCEAYGENGVSVYTPL